MKKTTKFIFAVSITVFLVCVISTGICMISFAAEDTPVPEEISSDVWYTLDNITGISVEEDSIDISCSDGGHSFEYSITFPTAGGFRFCAGESGLFTPDAVYTDLDCQINTPEYVRVKSPDGTLIDLKKHNGNWTLAVYNSDMFRVCEFDMSQMALGYDNDGNLIQVRFGAPLNEGEMLYGFGEQFDKINRVGTTFNFWNTADWGMTPYKFITLWHSSNGYSVYFNSSYYGKADIGVADSSKYTMQFDGPYLDFYVWTGTPIENIESYSKITGTNYLAPKWAYQYLAGSCSTYWDDNGGRNESGTSGLLRDYMEQYEALGTPNIAAVGGEDSLWLFNSNYDILSDTGTRMMAWYRPFGRNLYGIAGSLNVSAADSEYLVPYYRKANDPSRYYTTDMYSIDYTHPNAKLYLSNLWDAAIEKGLCGWMLDYGDRVAYDTLSYNGKTGAEMHNLSQYYYSKLFNEYVTEKLGDDFFVYARSAVAGSQKYSAAFAGDHVGSYESLEKVIRGGITLGASGFSNWGSDVAGLQSATSDKVYARWIEMGTFSPIFRSHGTTAGPWKYPQAAPIYSKYYWIRENILDKVYSSAVESSKNSSPMIKGMALAYPNDLDLMTNETQYIFCDDMLVRVVLNKTTAEVILPIGTWTDFWNGENYEGNQTITVDCPLDTIPVFLRSGTVMPVKLSAETLNIGDTMLNKDTVDALLVTAPDAGSSRTSRVWIDKDNYVDFSSDYAIVNDGGDVLRGFKISAESIDRRLIVVRGTKAEEVYFNNGTKLDKLDSLPTDESRIGYYIDEENNTTYIRVSSDISDVITDLHIVSSKSVASVPSEILGGFKDLNMQAWYVDSLAYCVENGILKGKGNDYTLAPDANMTRAEFVTVLARLSGDYNPDDYTGSEEKFTDVTKGSWYYSAVMWAYEHRIVSGKTATEFWPDATMTRQEMCKMISVFAKKYGIDIREKADMAFSDISNSWGYDYIMSCAKAGLVNGTGNGLFGPDGTATRAAVAKIIYNIYTRTV